MALTLRNWLIGYYIVEYEQQGSDRARYGERLLDNLAADLRRGLGKGFTRRYLEIFRQFYLRYPIAQSLISQFALTLPYASTVPFQPFDWQDDAYFRRLFHELPWTHFIEVVRMDDPLKRAFHEIEALKNRWSVREQKRDPRRVRPRRPEQSHLRVAIPAPNPHARAAGPVREPNPPAAGAVTCSGRPVRSTRAPRPGRVPGMCWRRPPRRVYWTARGPQVFRTSAP